MTMKSGGMYIGGGFEPDKIDALVFDCDGVLVDITESYDAAIKKTVKHVLGPAGISPIDIGHEIIDGFKSTGGFNDEVDLAYAIIISIATAARSGRNQEEFIHDVIKNADSRGIASVERYVKGMADISDILEKTSHPGPSRKSPLYHTFDQLFYGGDLYKSLFGGDSEFAGPGLIERDRVILTGDLAGSLSAKFGSRIAMVTGRGFKSARHSLGGLLDGFDLGNSVFLEDEPRELAKPNPKPLLDAIGGMGGTTTMYVGDSMEDLLMAKETSKRGCRAVFCGITGTSKNPQAKMDLFRHNGAEIVLDSIHQIPKALNLE
ncbi:MAG: phosphatase [Nitrosopumilus sp. H13]|nr:MAG: phosphatase [Nitrosopumilus sp. H13]